jgi:small GTP-binding protein
LRLARSTISLFALPQALGATGAARFSATADPLYRKKFAMDEHAPITVKLILIGSSGVGKSSLLRSFRDHGFVAETAPTIAPAFSEIPVDCGALRPVTLQVWDTAGQEQYQSVSQLFYRDAQVAFACFDGRDSLARVDDWAFRLRETVPDCRLFLIVTKSDLLDDDARIALTSEGARAAAALGAGCFLTSAKTGQGVPEAFLGAAKAGAEITATRRSFGPPRAPPPLPRPAQRGPCC